VNSISGGIDEIVQNATRVDDSTRKVRDASRAYG